MKKNIFIRKKWDEEDILFFIHFEDGVAIRQIEISSNSKKCLSLENPIIGDSMLYDQPLDQLNLYKSDFINQEEFEKNWND